MARVFVIVFVPITVLGSLFVFLLSLVYRFAPKAAQESLEALWGHSWPASTLRYRPWRSSIPTADEEIRQLNAEREVPGEVPERVQECSLQLTVSPITKLKMIAIMRRSL